MSKRMVLNQFKARQSTRDRLNRLQRRGTLRSIVAGYQSSQAYALNESYRAPEPGEVRYVHPVPRRSLWPLP